MFRGQGQIRPYHTQAVGVVPELDDIFSYWFIDKVQVLGIEAENNLLNEVCSVIVLIDIYLCLLMFIEGHAGLWCESHQAELKWLFAACVHVCE